MSSDHTDIKRRGKTCVYKEMTRENIHADESETRGNMGISWDMCVHLLERGKEEGERRGGEYR